jgi:hypothetical protein
MHIVGTLILLLAIFGITIQIVRKPDQANALLGAGTTTYVAMQHALEGRQA